MSKTATVDLSQFQQILRDYQQEAVQDALLLVHKATERDPGRRLYSAPTGSGKGSIELALLRALRERGKYTTILTPSLEVIRGFLERCGAGDLSGWSKAKIAKTAEEIGISTPIRYQNSIMRRDRQVDDVIIYDEAHHAVQGGAVAGTLFALSPAATWVGFTATPFRGTPRGTIELREAWGEPKVMLTIPQALKREFISIPHVCIKPLVDDDQIRVVKGQFVVKSVTKEVGSRLDDILNGATRMAAKRPTCLVVPSTEVAMSCGVRAKELGLNIRVVTQVTKAKGRAEAYAACRDEGAVLVVIDLLREGVDFPWLRAMVDASPTLSPVKWMQRIGRIMRPGERGYYICVCRNVERHAYLLCGAIPAQIIAEAQQAFPQPTERTAMRALGFEALGKFKQIELPLRDGLKGGMFIVYAQVEEGIWDTYASLIHPGKQKPITAFRRDETREDGSKKWGKWARCELPTDLVGYATSKWRNAPSEKQMAWWKRAAAAAGLDPQADGLTGRSFQALPLLLDCKARL